MLALIRHVRRASKHHRSHEWDSGELVLLGVLVVLIAGVATVVANAVMSHETSREKPAVVSFQYCAQWQSAYKSQTCVRYATGHETRVVIHREGPLWSYDTYEVVR